MKKGLNWIKAHPYSLYVLYFIPYVIYFASIEAFLTPKYYIHVPFDDQIQFNEYFIIFYFAWFFYMAIPLLYFLRKNKEEFRDLCFFMFSGMTISLIIQTIFPNALDLRVEVTGHNIFADLCRMLYSIDTPTNVCPSIHVGSSIAIGLAILRSRELQHKLGIKCFSTFLMIGICISTMTLKQHSIIDVIAAIGLSGLLYLVTYHLPYRTWIQKTPLAFLYKNKND